jgi:hypothetical protein
MDVEMNHLLGTSFVKIAARKLGVRIVMISISVGRGCKK